MQTHDFFFELPQELIAQTPIEPRDSSRLMVLNRETGAIAHKAFSDLEQLLQPGDLLVLNDSKVLPARLLGTAVNSESPMELLLLEQKEQSVWETLVRPGKRAKVGARFTFGQGLLQAEILEILEGGNRLVRFTQEGNFYEALEQVGQMPLPPYITERLANPQRYQTVYAKEIGSSAAPTAGLHFTENLLTRLKEKGVLVEFVTLHVGLGTFRPVKVEDLIEHKMHAEHYALPQSTADAVNRCKEQGGRVIAVGTTSCRTLESVGRAGLPLKAEEGYTDIFIYPGKKFHVIDGLITNFHLPESTLIMLVSAFAGRENVLNAYAQAIAEKYRFFSFGDAMFMGSNL